jgi:hypothetical protein
MNSYAQGAMGAERNTQNGGGLAVLPTIVLIMNHDFHFIIEKC